MATRGMENVTEADLRALKAGRDASPKPSKYHNKRCEWNGEKFDSRAEMEWYIGLTLREKNGEIRQLARQVPIPLYAPIFTNGLRQGDARAEVARYIADAVYFEQRGDRWVRIVADRKSKATRTAVYKLKARWLAIQEGIDILEVL